MSQTTHVLDFLGCATHFRCIDLIMCREVCHSSYIPGGRWTSTSLLSLKGIRADRIRRWPLHPSHGHDLKLTSLLNGIRVYLVGLYSVSGGTGQGGSTCSTPSIFKMHVFAGASKVFIFSTSYHYERHTFSKQASRLPLHYVPGGPWSLLCMLDCVPYTSWTGGIVSFGSLVKKVVSL